MKNLKLILFFVMLGMYAAGIAVGSMRQIKTDNQEEMYAYLESAVSGYEVTAADSIKSVAADNAKTLIAAALGGLFRIGPAAVAAVILIKGYTAGFAITAVLRCYGIKGLILCGANLLSAMLLIPVLAYYGSASAYNLFYNRREKGIFFRKYFFLLILLTAIFCADSLLRGFFSSIFMKFADFVAKSV